MALDGTTPPDPPHQPRRTVHVGVLCLLMALPFIQYQTELLPDLPLNGAEQPPKTPSLTVNTWLDGSFANAVEPYLGAHIGFRGVFIRVANQVGYSVFGSLIGYQGPSVVLGKEGWLYEKHYVETYTQRGAHTDEAGRQALVAELVAFQQELQRHGIAFALVISPSKAEIVPQYLPDHLQARRAANPQPTTYELIVPELQRAGVRTIDGHALFVELRDKEPYLFPPGGTHWTYYGSLLFCLHLFEELSSVMPGRIALPEPQGVVWRKAMGTDGDLEQFINMFWFPSMDARLPYLRLKARPRPAEQRLSILMLGDSFAFTMVDMIGLMRVARDLDLLYYFRRHVHYPTPVLDSGGLLPHRSLSVPMDRSRVDWDRLLFHKDLVLLEINEVAIDVLAKEGAGWS
ncbi:MAG: hypothetical protein AAFX99_31010, partial [Myxococcota bacterium]